MHASKRHTGDLDAAGTRQHGIVRPQGDGAGHQTDDLAASGQVQHRKPFWNGMLFDAASLAIAWNQVQIGCMEKADNRQGHQDPHPGLGHCSRPDRLAAFARYP